MNALNAVPTSVHTFLAAHGIGESNEIRSMVSGVWNLSLQWFHERLSEVFMIWDSGVRYLVNGVLVALS